MDDTSIELLKKIVASADCLSCRDWYTVNMLKGKNLKAEMHGCPAWYDIENVPRSELKTIKGINKICISDPANINNYRVTAQLLELLLELYPNAEVTFVFHRGTWEKEEGKRGEKRAEIIKPILEKNKIRYIDISG